MIFWAVFGLIVAAFFGIAFFSRSRMGVAILALLAGSILATMWADDLTMFFASMGVTVTHPPLKSLVAAALTLLPVLLLSSRGAHFTAMPRRLVGAGVFTLLATTLLLPVIESALIIDITAKPVFDFLHQYYTMIVTIGLAVGVLDLLFHKAPKSPKPSKH